MKKKTPMIALYVLVFCCAAAVFAAPAIDKVRQLYVMGQLEKAKQEAIQNGEDYVIAKGKNIEINNAEIAKIVAAYENFNSSSTKEDAIAFVAKRAALEAEAIRLGYSVTEEEVQDYINLQIEWGKDAVNYDQFEKFLEGAEMTAEEYWHSQYDMLKQELLFGKLLNDKKTEWEQRPSFRSAATQDDKIRIYNEQVEQYKQELLEAENLVVLEE